jgi:hypothetical protein
VRCCASYPAEVQGVVVPVCGQVRVGPRPSMLQELLDGSRGLHVALQQGLKLELSDGVQGGPAAQLVLRGLQLCLGSDAGVALDGALLGQLRRTGLSGGGEGVGWGVRGVGA